VKNSPKTKNLFSAEILKDKGHLGKIVALQPLVGTEVESYMSEANELPPTQVRLNYAIKFEWFSRLCLLWVVSDVLKSSMTLQTVG
jgi:hypothetical protein